jgi:hypothetical protein
MKNIILNISFDDDNCYTGCGTSEEVILGCVNLVMEIDLEGENIIKDNWKVEEVKQNPLIGRNPAQYLNNIQSEINNNISNWGVGYTAEVMLDFAKQYHLEQLQNSNKS